jgi:enamine deaminase RidA (YjgF/YER057c/UK114 family)
MNPVPINPKDWPPPRGYSNGMLGEGRLLLTGGQIGWDASGRFAEGFVPQVAQTLANIVAIVREAGGEVDHIARLTWYVVDVAEYRASLPALGPAYRAVMGRHFPAMAVVGVAALVEPAARVEIEATAILPRDAGALGKPSAEPLEISSSPASARSASSAVPNPATAGSASAGFPTAGPPPPPASPR